MGAPAGASRASGAPARCSPPAPAASSPGSPSRTDPPGWRRTTGPEPRGEHTPGVRTQTGLRSTRFPGRVIPSRTLDSGCVDRRSSTGLAHLDLPLVPMPTLHASHARLTGVSFTLTPPQWGAHEQEKGHETTASRFHPDKAVPVGAQGIRRDPLRSDPPLPTPMPTTQGLLLLE